MVIQNQQELLLIILGKGRNLRFFRRKVIIFWAEHLATSRRAMLAHQGSGPANESSWPSYFSRRYLVQQFRHAQRTRPCVALIHRYFEWRNIGRQRQPFLIRRKDRRPLAIAGIWETWRGHLASGEPVESCTLLSLAPARQQASAGKRTPVILSPEQYPLWLDPESSHLDGLGRIFQANLDLDIVAMPIT